MNDQNQDEKKGGNIPSKLDSLVDHFNGVISDIRKLMEEVESKSTELDKEKAGMAELKSDLDDANKRLQEGEKFLESRQASIDKREKDVAEKESSLIAREKNVFDREIALKDAEGNLKPRETQILEKESSLNAKEAALKEKEEYLLQKESELLGSEESLKVAREKLSKKENELYAMEEELLSKRKMLISREESLRHKISVKQELPSTSSAQPGTKEELPDVKGQLAKVLGEESDAEITETAGTDAVIENELPSKIKVEQAGSDSAGYDEGEEIMKVLTDVQKLQEKAQYMGADNTDISTAQMLKDKASRVSTSKEALKLLIDSKDILNRAIQKRLLQSSKDEAMAKETWRELQQHSAVQPADKQPVEQEVKQNQKNEHTKMILCPACGSKNVIDEGATIMQCRSCGYRGPLAQQEKQSGFDKGKKRILTR